MFSSIKRVHVLQLVVLSLLYFLVFPLNSLVTLTTELDSTSYIQTSEINGSFILFNQGTEDVTIVCPCDPPYEISLDGSYLVSGHYDVVTPITIPSNSESRFDFILEDTLNIGVHQIYCTLLLMSGNEMSSETVTFDVNNSAPTSVITQQNLVILEDQFATTHVECLFEDINIEYGDFLTYEVTQVSDNNIQFYISNDIFTMIPDDNWNGEETFNIIATDSYGSSAVSSIILTVEPLDDPFEVISFSPDNIQEVYLNGENTHFEIETSDVDGDVEYQWSIDSEILNLNGNSLEYINYELGNHTIVCVVSDDNSSTTIQWNCNYFLENQVDEYDFVQLLGNYPNPFNPTTTIKYSVMKDNSKVEISVYNIKGQLVRKLENGIKEKGNHSVIWSGKDSFDKKVSSGIYFYNLKIDGKVVNSQKCLMLK